MFDEIIKHIRSIYPDLEQIPLHAPVFRGNEKTYLNNCIDSTYVSSVGQYVDTFEEMLAQYTGAKRAVACVNGTNALHIALIIAGVERSDEVITQALTFIATCNAIAYIGAQPVFIDVDIDTMGLSPVAVEKWLSENAIIKDKQCYNKNTGRRIKACVPMHTFGHPVHLDELVDVCKRYQIELVEDAAEALGSYYKGKHVGTFGKVGVLSFNGNKIITTGGGGALLFNDEKLAIKAKHLTTQAKISHPWEFVHDEIGYNYRMPNLNAALGCAQIEQIESYLKTKRELANNYKEFFEKLDIHFVTEPEHCKSNYWLNAIVLKNKVERDKCLEYLNNNGVMVRPIWEIMSRLPMFKDCDKDDLMETKWLKERVVNIPSSYFV